MPNWCNAHYVFEGELSELADLHQKLTGLTERAESLVENEFSKNWLGNVAELFGKNWEDTDCRGTFSSIDLSDGRIRLSTETAWADCSSLWDLVCSRYKTIRYYFLAEEGGCCYYVTNDAEGKYFPERYNLYIDGEDEHDFGTLSEALKVASEKLGKEIKTVEEVEAAIKRHNEDNPDDPIYFNEYEVVENNSITRIWKEI